MLSELRTPTPANGYATPALASVSPEATPSSQHDPPTR
jgi:hypothetical protein